MKTRARRVVLRAVIDTNVWISALIRPDGSPGRVLKALSERKFILLLSDPLIQEVVEVLTRPRVTRKYGLTGAHATEFVALLRERGESVHVTGSMQLCRDPDDDEAMYEQDLRPCHSITPDAPRTLQVSGKSRSP